MADRSAIEWTDASWSPIRAARLVLGQRTRGAGGVCRSGNWSMFSP